MAHYVNQDVKASNGGTKKQWHSYLYH